MAAVRTRRVISAGSHDKHLSKLLSYILRHGAHEEGLAMNSEGYVAVSDLLKHAKFKKYTLTHIQNVVENNDKQRFALSYDSDGNCLIRANQGHTVEITDLAMEEVNPDEISKAIHGTYERCIPSIEKSGLSRMARNHIHMAVDYPGKSGVISGMRSSCDYYVIVDIKKAMAEGGLKFYKSANNVILCPGDERGYIPFKYCKIKKRQN